MNQARATVPTEHASRYLQQLCKHWAHKFPVTFDAMSGVIEMPEGRIVRLTARDDGLDIAIDLPDAAMAERMQHVVADHLARFAFREELVFHWA